MRHLVSIGGGLASTILLPDLVIQKYGNENIELVTCVLKGESPDVGRMINECEQRTGLAVTRLSYHPERKYIVNPKFSEKWGIWDTFEANKFIANSRVDICSRMLKRETFKSYVQATTCPESTIIHVGIGREEIDRTIAIGGRWRQAGYTVAFDLLELPEDTRNNYEKCMSILGWSPKAYRIGLKHNNCRGGCVKAGQYQWILVLEHEPRTFFYHAEKERRFQIKFNTTHTILRETVNGEIHPLPLYELAARYYQGKFNKPQQMDLFNKITGCSWCDANG